MSHKNYSNFARTAEYTETTVVNEAEVHEATTNVSVVTEAEVLENETVEIPEIVDSTGNTTEDVAGESTEEPTTEEPKVDEPEVTEEPKTELKGIGMVSGCKKLNVRAEASIDADIVTVISAGTEVVIEDTEDDFYKVCTGDNKIGYCMKKFIVIK